MKNLILLVCFFLAGSMSLSAQAKACKKSGKACCAKKASAAATQTKVAAASMTADLTAAEELAEGDENIQARVNDETGEKSFYQKSQCEVSGKVSWCEVKYCDESKAFSKVASASMERGTEAGVAKSVETETTSAKKACCKKGSEKDCCKGKKACKKSGESK